MDARITILEHDVRDIKDAIRRLEPAVIRIEAGVAHLPTSKEIAEIRGRLSQLPTKWTVFAFVFAGTIAVPGLILTIASKWQWIVKQF